MMKMHDSLLHPGEVRCHLSALGSALVATLIGSSVTLALLVGCASAGPGQQAGTAGTAEAREEIHKDVVRGIFERAWNEADFEGLDDVISDRARFHFRGRTMSTGLDDLKRLVALWQDAFADLTFTVEDLVAEGDLVAVRLTFRGIHRGEWKGLAPTGKRIEVTEMMFFRFSESKVIELWEDYDEYGMRLQLSEEP